MKIVAHHMNGRYCIAFTKDGHQVHTEWIEEHDPGTYERQLPDGLLFDEHRLSIAIGGLDFDYRVTE